MPIDTDGRKSMSKFDLIADRYADPAQYRPRKIYNDVVKRFVDLLLATVCLILLTPVYGIIAILVKLDTPGKVFYRGIRTGYHGRQFRVFKFRSMVDGAEKLGGGTTAYNDKRITRVGRYLRKTKLDEIPQLFNIILGHVSFVGPRPELPKYTDMYQNEQKIILDVRPGITDISSIRYIYLEEIVGETNADERYERDILHKKNELRVQYIVRQSIFLDTWLLLETIRRVIKKTFYFMLGTGGTDHARTSYAEKV